MALLVKIPEEKLCLAMNERPWEGVCAETDGTTGHLILWKDWNFTGLGDNRLILA